MRAILRPWPADSTARPTVTVCINDRDERFAPCCGRHGGPEILAAIREGVAARQMNVDVQTIQCLGLCAKGPNLRVTPSGSLFQAVTVGDVPEFIDSLEREISAVPATSQGGTP
jgi:(2Fe-2S) ferredoxin